VTLGFVVVLAEGQAGVDEDRTLFPAAVGDGAWLFIGAVAIVGVDIADGVAVGQTR
jgi:hypothetical protein